MSEESEKSRRESEEEGEIIYECSEGVATIILNRPAVLNALNDAMLAELNDVFERAEKDEDVRAVVLTGAGNNFCAGADISALEHSTVEDARDFARRLQLLTERIEAFPKPVLAKVRGFCLGGGFELALACDFRFASEDAKFGFPEVNLGIIPGGGGTQRLARIVGRTKAAELLFTGERISAEEALRMGILNAVSPAEPENALDDAVSKFLEKLLAKSAIALRMLKRALQGLEMPLHSALLLENECFANAFSTEDAKEGIKAFKEKRKPKFKGK